MHVLFFGCLVKWPRQERMGRAFSDDLRMTDCRGERARRGVLSCACKALWCELGVCAQGAPAAKKNRRITRQPQLRYGVPSRMSEPVKVYMLALVEAQADITIAELREKIEAEQGVSASWSSVRRWVKKLGLRLKKSRSTPASVTRKPTSKRVRVRRADPCDAAGTADFPGRERCDNLDDPASRTLSGRPAHP